jgi:ADP-ribose pyrophosphatase
MTTTLPGEYTHPDVLRAALAGEDRAERETDPTRIDWQARQARALIPFSVIDGRPVNPCEATGRTGRNEMGLWGETPCADALVTATTNEGTLRWLLMVERGDDRGWAVPGGRIEDGEDGVRAAIRELGEETGLFLDTGDITRELPARYVPDPRSSDEAWAVTIPVHFRFKCRVHELPQVTGADDARRAAWVPAQTYDGLASYLAKQYSGQVFAAHRQMLREFLDEPGTPETPAAPDRPAVSRGAGDDLAAAAERKLEELATLPPGDGDLASVLATGLSAVTLAVLAHREAAKDNSDSLLSILDAGLTQASDHIAAAGSYGCDIANAIDDASLLHWLRQAGARIAAIRPAWPMRRVPRRIKATVTIEAGEGLL